MEQGTHTQTITRCIYCTKPIFITPAGHWAHTDTMRCWCDSPRTTVAHSGDRFAV